jgi:hypothetical protein
MLIMYGKEWWGYMGAIGKAVGKFVGGFVGREGSNALLGRKHRKCGGELGEAAGEKLGELSPFKKGGRVRKTGKAVVHKGEYILPRGVAPTARQKRMVAKRGGRK